VYLISGFLFFLKIVDLPSAGWFHFFSRIWMGGLGTSMFFMVGICKVL
jgi:hypothetical protein